MLKDKIKYIESVTINKDNIEIKYKNCTDENGNAIIAEIIPDFNADFNKLLMEVDFEKEKEVEECIINIV